MRKRYIYVKTPEIDHSNVCAHIVEHCVLTRNNLSVQDFYMFCDIQGESYSGYTRYDLHKKIDLEIFLKIICNPLDKKVFKKEMLAFKEETKEKIFPDIFKKEIEKLLYPKERKSKTKLPSWADVSTYHTHYYTRENMIICDSRYKLLENNIVIQSPWKRSLHIHKEAIVSIAWEKNKITILPYTHRKAQVLLYFVEFLYDTYMEYSQRHFYGRYNFPTACMIEIGNHVCIAIPQGTPETISNDFLYEAKKKFCTISLDEYARKIEIVNLLALWQLPSDKDIKDFIVDIDLATIRKIIR